eukprot:GHVP01030824.1.p1 GENE.GHVP01030824.1~~GHVP01030824.1.p1  ORF type:complete len:430 (-),score=54.46 GHVP01030824.1:106-1209(-)
MASGASSSSASTLSSTRSAAGGASMIPSWVPYKTPKNPKGDVKLVASSGEVGENGIFTYKTDSSVTKVAWGTKDKEVQKANTENTQQRASDLNFCVGRPTTFYLSQGAQSYSYPEAYRGAFPTGYPAPGAYSPAGFPAPGAYSPTGFPAPGAYPPAGYPGAYPPTPQMPTYQQPQVPATQPAASGNQLAGGEAISALPVHPTSSPSSQAPAFGAQPSYYPSAYNPYPAPAPYSSYGGSYPTPTALPYGYPPHFGAPSQQPMVGYPLFVTPRPTFPNSPSFSAEGNQNAAAPAQKQSTFYIMEKKIKKQARSMGTVRDDIPSLAPAPPAPKSPVPEPQQPHNPNYDALPYEVNPYNDGSIGSYEYYTY